MATKNFMQGIILFISVRDPLLGKSIGAYLPTEAVGLYFPVGSISSDKYRKLENILMPVLLLQIQFSIP